MLSFLSFLIVLAVFFHNVVGHGYPARIKGGAKGAASMGFMITKENNFLRSETAMGLDYPGNSFRGGCGGTEPRPASKNVTAVNIPLGIKKAEAAGLPQVDANGKLQLSWAQINAGSDGAGPIRCRVDPTGVGLNFVDCKVTKNVGDGGGNSFNAMEIQLDPKLVCTGGNGSTCLLKIFNPNKFGSCFAVKSPAVTNRSGNNAVAGGTKTVTVTVTQKAAPCSNKKTAKRGRGKFVNRL